MPFRVELTNRAQRDLIRIFDYIDAASSQAATRWYNGLEELILSLRDLPERGTMTAYDPTLRFDRLTLFQPVEPKPAVAFLA